MTDVCVYYFPGGYSLPDTWTPMNPGDKCVKVKLKATDKEYIDVSQAIKKSANLNILEVCVFFRIMYTSSNI